jgi:hypothetical protein
MKNLMILGCLFATLGSASAQSQRFPMDQRIQLSEPCASVAKWLTQGFAPAGHWQLRSYEQGLGLLTFKLLDMPLSKADVRAYVDDPKAKNVRGDQVAFTLRNLVSSSLSFDSAPASSGESCTIAAGIKFVGKDGQSFLSRGTAEAGILDAIDARYKAHGLDY